MQRKKLVVGIIAAAAFGAGLYFAYAHWIGPKGNSRESLLRTLPVDATAVIYVDIAELRQGPMLKNISGWSAGATIDPEYKQFVKETGFDYEKDLSRVGIAVESHGATRNYFALADGNFDRKKIEAYLRKSGNAEQKGTRETFHLPAGKQGRTISVSFVSNERVALTDGDDLGAEIEAGQRSTGHAEWMERFERLAGTPMFALVRQDTAIGSAFNAQAPGGLRSPQLAQLLNQLLWISIAGKPEGEAFRTVVEGECPNEASMRQLADFLNGIALMAQAGLNDPKLRQQMDPALREAYLQLLNSADVAKLDRGDSKSVRVVLVITPEIWAKLASTQQFAEPAAQPEKKAPETAGKESSPKRKKTGTQIPAKHL
jgi:hypothetical protein